MKNIKKLLAILLTTVLLATMAVPALAEVVENAEKALKLQAIGLMAGGANDLNLDQPLNRIQGLTFAIRAAGKEAEALAMSDSEVNSILANVVDRGDIPNWAYGYAHKYVAYAVKHKFTLGTDSTILPKVRFGPMDPISGTSFLVFLMKSGMGYDDVTTADIIDRAIIEAKIINPSQAAKYQNKPALIRDDAAGILYSAAMNGINANGKKLIDSLIESGFVNKQNAIDAGFIEEEVLTLSVQAIGVRKLQVNFSNIVDTTRASIEVRRGTIKPAVKSITFANDKKSATIEFNTDMAAGEYTVTVTGLPSGTLSGTVTVETSKLTTIRFLSDIAVKKGNNITVNVVGENQYGEDITSRLNSSNVSASKGTSASILNGVVTVYGTSSDYFKVDDLVVITIVDAATGAVGTKAVKVASSAAIESISFGELTTDDDNLKGKDINVEAMTTNAYKYYLPIIIMDQYGNRLKADDLGDFQLFTSDPTIVKLASTPIVNHSEMGTVIKFEDTGHEKSGTVVITAVAPSTGKNAFKTITVLDNPKIDMVYLSAPSGELKQNTATILPVTVVDIFGKQVALKDIAFNISGSTMTLNTNTVMTVHGGTFSVEKNYATGVTNIMLTPTSQHVIITVTTATGKSQNLNLTAVDAPVATYIKGVSSDFATMLANDPTLYTELKGKVTFYDQYGDNIEAPVYKTTKANGSSPYYVITEKSDNDRTIFNPSTGVIYATSNPGTETYVIELLDKDSNTIDTYEVTITIVRLSDITSYGINDLNKFYTESDAASAGTHSQKIEIHGLVGGRRVVVNQNMITNINATNGLIGINPSTGVYTPTDVNTNGADKTSVLTVYVNNGTTIIPVTKNVVFSNAIPLAKSLVIKYDGVTVGSESIQVPYTELNGKSLLAISNDAVRSKLVFSAVDQYGEERTSNFYNFVVTGNTTSGTVNSQGFASGFKASDAGKSLQLNVFIDNLYKQLTITVE